MCEKTPFHSIFLLKKIIFFAQSFYYIKTVNVFILILTNEKTALFQNCNYPFVFIVLLCWTSPSKSENYLMAKLNLSDILSRDRIKIKDINDFFIWALVLFLS